MTPDHPGCRTIQDRDECIQAARRELARLKKGPCLPVATESVNDQRARLLKETEGWTLENIATSHWRTSPSIMRRLRVAAGLDGETGLPPEMADDKGLDLRSRARELNRQGMSQRQISMVLSQDGRTVSQSTVCRLIRKAA